MAYRLYRKLRNLLVIFCIYILMNNKMFTYVFKYSYYLRLKLYLYELFQYILQYLDDKNKFLFYQKQLCDVHMDI